MRAGHALGAPSASLLEESQEAHPAMELVMALEPSFDIVWQGEILQ